MALWMKIVAGIVVVVGLFLAYVSTKSGKFRYERNGLIQAPASKIFPYISNLRKGKEWSPYEKMDPDMQTKFTGDDGAVGSKMEFVGEKSGSGSVEMLKMVPNEVVEQRLLMTKPFNADRLVGFRLTPEGSATRFSWEMSGDGGFLSKLMTTLIDCEKMIGDQFTTGINTLKEVVEKQP